MSQAIPPTSSSRAGEPHRGALILVLGILSIVLCQLLGPFAWIMGKGDLAKMDAGQMDAEGRGLTQAGKICGMIGTILLCLSLLLTILYFIIIIIFVGAAAAGAGSNP
ncbi:MAG: hypothetical protein R3B57_07930 [Phycisphaerales bacterium]